MLAGNAGLYLPVSRCELKEGLEIQILTDTTAITYYAQSKVMRNVAHWKKYAFLKDVAATQLQYIGALATADPAFLRQARNLDCFPF